MNRVKKLKKIDINLVSYSFDKEGLMVFNQKELVKYLEGEELKNITIKETKATIEDAFMELAK